jgi:hypothetical protein
MKNEKNLKIDHHMNATSQMQSLKKTLTLEPLVPFNVVEFKGFLWC